MKKSVVIAMVLGLVSIAFAADSSWLGGTGDWNNSANWSGGILPDIATNQGAFIDVDGSVVNVTGTGANAGRIFQGQATAPASTTINISGELRCNAWFSVGRNAGNTGVVNVLDGGNLITKGLAAGYDGVGTLNIEGGRVQIGLDSANVLGLFCAQRTGSTYGYVNLKGGTLDMSLIAGTNHFQFAVNGATATLDIAGGELILPGNVTDLRSMIYVGGGTGTVNLLANGVAYANDSGFVYSYDGTNTTITAIPEPATVALLGLGGLVLIRRKRS